MKRVSADLVTATMIFAAFFSGLPAQPAGAVVTETLKLVPTDSAPGDDFGETVAVSGGVAVVGAPGSGPGGAAYVFDTTTGQQLFKLIPDDLLTGTGFGDGAMAVSNGLAYVGGARDTNGTAAIWVFDLANGDQVVKWTPEDADAITTFGASIAIHGDMAIVGAPLTDVSGFENAGAAYLIDRATGGQIAKLVSGSAQMSARFGDSVAIGGGLAAVYDRDEQPSVALFDTVTGDQLADIPAPDSSLTGSSAAIAGDRLLIGAPSVFPGAISGIYNVADPNNITEQLIPWPAGPGGWFFGHAVALSDSAALISTWSTDDITFSGIVHLFDPDTGELLESFRSSDAAEDDQFGWSIALDGQTLIVGARGFENTDSGAAYLFTIPEPGALVSWLALGLLACPRRGRAPARGLRRGL